MIAALAHAAAVAAALAARPPAVERSPTASLHASLEDAVAGALAGDPAVVAFGELHQTAATASVRSALRRFSEDELPALAPRLSHLVLETWIASGQCGETERAVVADVEKTTERPAHTESEIETLIRAAAAAGVQPRILTMSCDDYRSMRGEPVPGGAGGAGGAAESALKASGGVDFDRTLRITARALRDAVLAALANRNRANRAAGAVPTPSPVRRLIAVYGGALHNDVHPDPELAPYTFAPEIMAATLGRFVEIDLVVPEFVAASAASAAAVRAEPWWRAYLRLRRPGRTVLVRRSPRSFVIVFPAVGEGGGRRRGPSAPER